MRSIVLDARQLKSRSTAHAYLKEQLKLPEYYGANLDALYDCLTEMPKMEIRVVNSQMGGEYFEKIWRVLEEVQEEGIRIFKD